MKPSARTALAIALVTVAAACSSGGPAPATTSPPAGHPGPTATATVAPPTTAVGGQGGDAADFCAILIDEATRIGYLVNGVLVASPSVAMFQQLIEVGIARKDEVLAVTPPEIRDTIVAEFTWYESIAAFAAAHGWESVGTSGPTPPPAYLAGAAALTTFEETKCGIKTS